MRAVRASRERGSWLRFVGAAAAAAGGAIIALWLVGPAAQVDTKPPQCWADPGWSVPCGPALGLGAAIAAAMLAAGAVVLVTRPRPRR